MLEKAKFELDLILAQCKEEEAIEMQTKMNNHILEIVKIFADFGHSGYSANYAINLITKVLQQKNLTKLTYADDEFIKVSGEVYQNKRDCEVFKENGVITRLEGNKKIIIKKEEENK